MNDGPPDQVDALDVVVLLAELWLLAVLAWVGGGLGSGVRAVVLAIVLPLVAAVLWGLLLAPRAVRRLRHPARLMVKLLLLVAAAGSLAGSGEVFWAIGFLVLTAAVMTAGELRAARGRLAEP